MSNEPWDRFAAAALPTVIAVCRSDSIADSMGLEEYFARKAGDIADAMLAERAKRSGAGGEGLNAELLEQLSECVTSLVCAASDIRHEMKRDANARSRWEGVPEILDKRIADARSAIARATT